MYTRLLCRIGNGIANGDPRVAQSIVGTLRVPLEQSLPGIVDTLCGLTANAAWRQHMAR